MSCRVRVRVRVRASECQVRTHPPRRVRTCTKPKVMRVLMLRLWMAYTMASQPGHGFFGHMRTYTNLIREGSSTTTSAPTAMVMAVSAASPSSHKPQLWNFFTYPESRSQTMHKRPEWPGAHCLSVNWRNLSRPIAVLVGLSLLPPLMLVFPLLLLRLVLVLPLVGVVLTGVCVDDVLLLFMFMPAHWPPWMLHT